MTTDITELAHRLATCAKEDTYPVLSPADCGVLIEALEKKEGTIQVLESSYNEQIEALEKARKQIDELEYSNSELEKLAEQRLLRIGEVETKQRREYDGCVKEKTRLALELAEVKRRTVAVKLPKAHSATEYLFPVAVYSVQELTASLTAQGIKWEAE
ncbi:TPA: hypothetical protein ACNVLA_003753 [Klebsiella aerogenes]